MGAAATLTRLPLLLSLSGANAKSEREGSTTTCWGVRRRLLGVGGARQAPRPAAPRRRGLSPGACPPPRKRRGVFPAEGGWSPGTRAAPRGGSTVRGAKSTSGRGASGPWTGARAGWRRAAFEARAALTLSAPFPRPAAARVCRRGGRSAPEAQRGFVPRSGLGCEGGSASEPGRRAGLAPLWVPPLRSLAGQPPGRLPAAVTQARVLPLAAPAPRALRAPSYPVSPSDRTGAGCHRALQEEEEKFQRSQRACVRSSRAPGKPLTAAAPSASRAGGELASPRTGGTLSASLANVTKKRPERSDAGAL